MQKVCRKVSRILLPQIPCGPVDESPACVYPSQCPPCLSLPLSAVSLLLYTLSVRVQAIRRGAGG